MAVEDYEIQLGSEKDIRANMSYILANANHLMKANESDLAMSLFRLAIKNEKFAHCGWYGLGECYLQKGDTKRALHALRKAVAIKKLSFIALKILDVLEQVEDRNVQSELSLELARNFYEDSIILQRSKALYLSLHK